MWEEGTAEEAHEARKADAHGVLFNELMQEVKHSAPGARLSARLRTAIERLSPEERRALCSRTRDGCAPLFVACRRGNLEAVEYLVHVCNADLEQRGLYEVPDERSVHCVTALWCAAVAGHVGVLRALADAGADVDAGSDSGSTPVRSACFMTHLEVVRFLVARGADVRRPNHNGGTCLINSVQSVRLCAFLLDHGAEVNARDVQHKTALHYAIQEQRLETARLLLARGAEPRLCSRAGDDALRTAALKGADQVPPPPAASRRWTRYVQHKTALHYAIQEQRLETARLLLARGAEPRLCSRAGDDALRTAALKGADQVPPPPAASRRWTRYVQHKTALHYAIQEQRLETARLLLARGAEPRLCSRAGDDALRTAALKGADQVPPPPAASRRWTRYVQHKTALHYAIQEQRLETARLLLARGAEPRLCSRAGDDALRTAALKGADQVPPPPAASRRWTRYVQHKTALHYAIQEQRLETARLLLARGAEPRLCSRAGDDALRTAALKGADQVPPPPAASRRWTRYVQHKTALHYAIQEQRLETARLLLARGAEPRLCSRAGDDALRTAALKGADQIVALLAARARFGPARLADAYELLGATQLDEFNDVSACLAAWRRATALRHASPQYVEKTPQLPARRALRGAREWRAAAELEAAAADADALRLQALLVSARVLGESHKEHVFRLMFRGAAYADSFRYQRCIDLWSWAFEIRLAKDTILYADTCHTVCALTRLLLDARGSLAAPHAAAAHVTRLLLDSLPEAVEALRPRPVFKKQADTFDRALRCLVQLLQLLQEGAGGEAERAQALAAARRAVRLRLASAHTGDSLLHLACSRLTGAGAGAALARLLLAAGADPRQRNLARATPLHVAVVPYNYSADLVEALLAGGAHLDQPNKFGESARELLALHRGARVRPLRHVGLACLAARALLRHSPARDAPRHLQDFLDLHRP